MGCSSSQVSEVTIKASPSADSPAPRFKRSSHPQLTKCHSDNDQLQRHSSKSKLNRSLTMDSGQCSRLSLKEKKQQLNLSEIVIPDGFETSYAVVKQLSIDKPDSDCPYEHINIAKVRNGRGMVFAPVVKMNRLIQLHLEVSFFQHLDIARELHCPGIGSILDVIDSTAKNQYYIVYEYIHGKDVKSLLCELGTLEVSAARIMMMKILIVLQVYLCYISV